MSSTAQAGTGGRLLGLARRGYLAVVVVVLAYVVATRRDDLADLVDGGRPLVLVAALVASVGMLLLTSLFWTVALRTTGVAVAFRDVLSATLSSLPARYLPGSIWYAAGRVALLKGRGVPVVASSSVAAVEMLLVPVVGFALGAAVFALTGTDLPGGSGWLLAVAVALAVVGSPPVLGRLVAAVARRRGVADPPALTWRSHLRLTAVAVAFWTWSGGVFALYLAAFPAATDAGPVVIAAGYALAWGVGWLAVLAPQGIGVFEVVLAALLPSSGVAGLAVLLAGYRALIAVRDLLCASVGAVLLRGRGAPDRP